MASVRFKDLCSDVHDAELVGRFWQAAIGGEVQVMGDGAALLRGGLLYATWLNTVPEGKVVKNRVHLACTATRIASGARSHPARRA